MTLTPEQIEAGWVLHDGSDVCPIKDGRTVHQVLDNAGWFSDPDTEASEWHWGNKVAYRIIEAHGADAAPARPTPFPASMDDLVYDEDGFSQPFLTGGVWPEWLPKDASWQNNACSFDWEGKKAFDGEFAIRVRRREPKRETLEAYIHYDLCSPNIPVLIDLIDGQPDLSTLKIAEDAL